MTFLGFTLFQLIQLFFVLKSIEFIGSLVMEGVLFVFSLCLGIIKQSMQSK